MQINCQACPLRGIHLFTPHSEEHFRLMRRYKVNEITVQAGSILLAEGGRSNHLYTVLQGMGLRIKFVPEGGRQVLNFVFPDDCLGLQADFLGGLTHSVAAYEAMRLCVFRPSDLPDMFRNLPE